MELVDEADIAIAQLAFCLLVATVHWLTAINEHLAIIRVVEPPHYLQQGRLARSGGADDRDALGRACHLEIDSLQHLENRAALLESRGRHRDMRARLYQSYRSASAGAVLAATQAGYSVDTSASASAIPAIRATSPTRNSDGRSLMK